MPFSLSFSLTASAVVWFLYGLLIKDKYVAVSRVLLLLFPREQMEYRDRPRQSSLLC
jgi:solute carrier family 50 (sugar transporter)